MPAILSASTVLDYRAPFSSDFGVDSSSTRDALIAIIAYLPGLSCAQATHILRRNRNSRLSQQAVFKMLMQLVEEGVLIKEEKRYLLNQTWVKKGKSFFLEVEKRGLERQDAIVLV